MRFLRSRECRNHLRALGAWETWSSLGSGPGMAFRCEVNAPYVCVYVYDYIYIYIYHHLPTCVKILNYMSEFISLLVTYGISFAIRIYQNCPESQKYLYTKGRSPCITFKIFKEKRDLTIHNLKLQLQLVAQPQELQAMPLVPEAARLSQRRRLLLACRNGRVKIKELWKLKSEGREVRTCCWFSSSSSSFFFFFLLLWCGHVGFVDFFCAVVGMWFDGR